MPTSNELGHRGMDMRSFKGATKTKYKLGSLKGLLCNIHSDTNFITNVKQIIQILKKKQTKQWQLPCHILARSL